MGHCDRPNFSGPKIKVLSKVHGLLFNKSRHYHSWHHHKHHKKVRYGVLIVSSIVIIGLLSTNLTPTKTHASVTANWNINTANNYTYDDSKVEFVDGVAQLKGATLSATGGTITTNGGYTIHTFNTGGTFTPNISMNVEVLAVAGGGGGGYAGGGGGGAGGLVYNSSLPLSVQPYGVTVGDGGNGSSNDSAAGSTGVSSVFSTITALGGGGGGSYGNHISGHDGGSGGGTAATGGSTGVIGLGTVGQGKNGGLYVIATPFPSGGGGGAGANGSNGSGSQAGAGGVGLSYSISGSSVYYAGGGGGGGTGQGAAAGAGGNGGGGGGSVNHSNAGTVGTANTGGGGGGGVNSSGGAATNGGKGGSGIVIIRYLTNVYPTDNPTLVPNTAQGYSTLTGFVETLGASSAGIIKYQITANGSDVTPTWYR